jgi:hypothetical protein
MRCADLTPGTGQHCQLQSFILIFFFTMTTPVLLPKGSDRDDQIQHRGMCHDTFALFMCVIIIIIIIIIIKFYVNNCPTRCNYIQFIYISKLLYIFRVVIPPIIRSSCHCVYSLWLSSKPNTLTTGCSSGHTNARVCRYSDISS